MAKDPSRSPKSKKSEAPTIPVDPSSTQETTSAVETTQAILGEKILVYLAIVSFSLAVLLLILTTFASGLINSPISRMSLICLTSLALATFAWVFYPHAVKAVKVKIPLLDWEITGFVGPFVLFMMTLGVLHWIFPNVGVDKGKNGDQNPELLATRYQFYRFKNQTMFIPAEQILFDGNKDHKSIWMIRNPDSASNGLKGLVVDFKEKDSLEVNIEVQSKLFKEKKGHIFKRETKPGVEIDFEFELALSP